MADTIRVSAEEFESIRFNKGIVLEDRITSHGRWSVGHTIVFRRGDRFYRTRYSVGATEMQEEYEPPYYECTRVVPVEKLVTVYEDHPLTP